MTRVMLPPKPSRRNETRDITKPIEAMLNSLPGVWAARNNSGALPAIGAGGKTYPLRYGLGKGSADIVGSVKLELLYLVPRIDGVADELRRIVVAQAFGLEVKQPGEVATPEQRGWAEAMRRRGWIVETVHGIDAAVAVVERIRSGL